jgi:hypothetical protein
MFKRIGRVIAKPFQAGAKKVATVAVAHAVNQLIPKEDAMGVTNWKTAFSGIAAIVAVVAKVVNGTGIGAEDIALVMGAVGLIFAKDKDVTGVGADATRKP